MKIKWMMRAFSSLIAAGAMLPLHATSPLPQGKSAPASGNISEDFSSGMENWWGEGGRKIWVEDGRLFVDANAAEGEAGIGATVWLRQPLEGDVEITCTVHVIASDIQANNINFFLHYSMPDGSDLYDSRARRADGAYKHYHNLNGYIATFLNDRKAEAGYDASGQTRLRFRLRRCPGFTLMAETYSENSGSELTYQCRLLKEGKSLRFFVDGKLQIEAEDPEPLGAGYFGLRTFATFLWWDDVSIRSLSPAGDKKNQ